MIYEDFEPFARRVALQNSNDPQYLMAALQIRGGKVVNFGVNGLRYQRSVSYFDRSLHAEADLVRRANFDLRGDKILVYRFNRATENGPAGRSRPCPMCANLLVNANVGRIYYTGDAAVHCCRGSELPMISSDPVYITRKYSNQNHIDKVNHLAYEKYTVYPRV